MKKISKFIISSFIGPFILTFFIALFILLMQFIWLYIDDMLGKGIEWYVIAELLMYSLANLVPLALPLAVLLASLMMFGNMGEHFELVSFKAAGISLQKIMQPLIIFVFLLSIGAFLFANSIIPIANLKFYSLLHDIREQKPAINIKPNVFYDEIKGYTIKIKDKTPMPDGGEMLKGLMIYNHTEDNGNRKLTVADSGFMTLSADKRFLSFKLFHGTDYQEKLEISANKVYPLTRVSFEENEEIINLSGFRLDRTDEELFKDDYRMLNLSQLSQRMDTFNVQYKKTLEEFNNSFGYLYKFNDTIIKKSLNKNKRFNQEESVMLDDYLSELDNTKVDQIYKIAIDNSRTNIGRVNASLLMLTQRKETIAAHEVEWHRKISFSLACLIMFFIGAPLGAIVRKGGLGMPVVISVVFFLIFWILSIIGEDMAKELVIPAYQGMWLSAAVLFPLGIFFTYKATRDSAIFNMEAYTKFFKKLVKKND